MLIRIILPTNVTYNLHLNFCFWKQIAILPKAWPQRFLPPPECCLSFFGICLFLIRFPISNSCQMIKHENCRVCNQRAFKTSLCHRPYVEAQECKSQIIVTVPKQSIHFFRMRIIDQPPALLNAHCLEKFVRPKKQTEEVCFRSLMICTYGHCCTRLF